MFIPCENVGETVFFNTLIKDFKEGNIVLCLISPLRTAIIWIKDKYLSDIE